MKILNSQNRINQLLLEFSKQVKLHNLADRYDINRVSENIMCPLLRLIFGYEGIRNLNYTDWKNYPGIDLADLENEIAFQITSTSDNDKIKDTLEKIVRHQLFRKYQRFIVYVLTEKKGRYSDKQYADIIQQKYSFNKDTDIWDYNDLVKAISKIDNTAQVRKIEQFLENTFGKGEPFAWKRQSAKTEELILNFVQISFPEQIYQADLSLDKEGTLEYMLQFNKKVKERIQDRDLVIEFLKTNMYHFPYDFVCYEGKLITFHDITNDEHPFRAVIDAGTITPYLTQNFYTINGEIDYNREKMFKDLLRRCLVRILKPHGIDWQEDEQLFIFTMNEEDDNEIIKHNKEKNRFERRVDWVRERFVCLRKMKTQKPDEVLYYQHLAFSGRFYQFQNKWYLQINPNWFFSYDGYRKNDYLNYYLKWLKREEDNNDVRNDFRFIMWFFKENFGHLFDESFVKFKDISYISGAPELDDRLWNPDKVIPDEDSEDKQPVTNENSFTSTLFDL